MLDRAQAARFALGEPEAGSQRSGTGAGGAFTYVTYPVRSLALGDTALPLTTLRSGDLSHVVSAIRRATGETVDGVIGQDVLTRFNGVIDVGTQTLFLRTPREG